MSRRRIFAGGRATGGVMSEMEQGYLDNGLVYNLTATTDRAFPAGVGGECIFDVAYVVVTFAVRLRLYVTVIVDGLVYPELLLDSLVAPAAEKTQRFEVPLRTDILNGLGAAVGKRAIRGCWIQFKVRTAFDGVYPPGAVRVDEMRVEGDVVVESLTPLAGAGA